MHETVRRIDALAAETAELLPALDRLTPAPSRIDAPGRMARLAEAIDDRRRTAWTAHLDSAQRLGREFDDLARAVRAAEAEYRMVDRDRGAAGWTS